MASDYDPRSWLSVSRLKSVTKCARQYELERVEKVPSKPAAWTVRGIAAHDSIDLWEKTDRSIDIEKHFHETAWPVAFEKTREKYPEVDDWMRTPRVGSVSRDLELREKDGASQVARYADRALAEEQDWRVIEAEFKFRLEFPGEDFVINGYIDQIREWWDGDRSIWDVKTSSNDETEDNRQLGVYRLGYLAATDYDIKYGAYWYTKLDRASKDIRLDVYTPEYVVGEFRKLDQILNQKLFLANPSIKNCFACGVAKHCLESKQQ